MLGLLALALLALVLARGFAGYPRVEGYRRLAAREVACVEAVALALFPPGGALAWSGAEAGIPRYVDRFLDASHPRQRALMHALFALIEHGTLLFPGPGGLRGMRRFSSLDLAARVAVLDDWSHSRLFLRRLAFTSLRAIFTFGYFAHRPVQDRLGLAPWRIEPPIREADLLYPRVGRRRDSIPYAREDLSPPGDAAPLDIAAPRQSPEAAR